MGIRIAKTNGYAAQGYNPGTIIFSKTNGYVAQYFPPSNVILSKTNGYVGQRDAATVTTRRRGFMNFSP